MLSFDLDTVILSIRLRSTILVGFLTFADDNYHDFIFQNSIWIPKDMNHGYWGWRRAYSIPEELIDQIKQLQPYLLSW